MDMRVFRASLLGWLFLGRSVGHSLLNVVHSGDCNRLADV